MDKATKSVKRYGLPDFDKPSEPTGLYDICMSYLNAINEPWDNFFMVCVQKNRHGYLSVLMKNS